MTPGAARAGRRFRSTRANLNIALVCYTRKEGSRHYEENHRPPAARRAQRPVARTRLLRDSGVGFGLVHFGTGSGSLQRLMACERRAFAGGHGRQSPLPPHLLPGRSPSWHARQQASSSQPRRARHAQSPAMRRIHAAHHDFEWMGTARRNLPPAFRIARFVVLPFRRIRQLLPTHEREDRDRSVRRRRHRGGNGADLHGVSAFCDCCGMRDVVRAPLVLPPRSGRSPCDRGRNLALVPARKRARGVRRCSERSSGRHRRRRAAARAFVDAPPSPFSRSS